MNAVRFDSRTTPAVTALFNGATKRARHRTHTTIDRQGAAGKRRQGDELSGWFGSFDQCPVAARGKLRANN